MKKRKITTKTLIVFLCSIVFLTLFSRSINHVLKPEVLVTNAKAGYLEKDKQKFSGDNIHLAYTNSQILAIEDRLDKPLIINRVSITEGQKVVKGQELISFSTVNYQEEIQELEEKIDAIYVEKDSFIYKIDKEKDELQQGIQLLEDKIYLLSKSDYTREEDLSSLEKRLNEAILSIKTNEQQLNQKNVLYSEGAISKEDIKNLEDKINELNINKTDLQVEIERKVESKLRIYNRELESKAKEFVYIDGKGILNNSSLELINKKLRKLEEDYSRLIKYKNELIIKANKDGIVKGLNIDDLKYYGDSKAIGYITTEESSLVIQVKVDNVSYDSETKVDIQIEGRYTEGHIEDITYRNGEKYLTLSTDNRIDFDNSKGIQIVVYNNSEYYDLILPKSCLIDEKAIYILKEKKGLFSNEFCLQKIEIELEDQNEFDFAIERNNIFRNDKIIAGWDRVLEDGDVVKVSNK